MTVEKIKVAAPTGVEIKISRLDNDVDNFVTVVVGKSTQVVKEVLVVDPPLPVPKPVVNFSSTPTTVVEGGPVTLMWSTSGAVSVSIDQGIGAVQLSGSKVVIPTGVGAVAYRLTATNSGGSTEAVVNVTVTAKPPVPVPGLLEAKGNNIQGQNQSGPSDFVDMAKALPAMPWGLFVDDRQTIARSMNGVAPKGYRRIHVYGHPNSLYSGTPAVVERDGVNKIEGLYPQFGDDPILSILPNLKKWPLRAGPRERAIMNPYTTWHGHTRRSADGVLHTTPSIPMWVGIVFDGTMSYAFRDGSISYPFKVPLTDGSFANDFTFHEPRGDNLFFVTDSKAGKILKVDRNFSPPVTAVLASGFGEASSVRSVNGNLYVADRIKGAVSKVTLAGVVTKLCDIPSAFWVDYKSNGNLVVMSLLRKLYEVNVTTGAATAILPSIESGLQTWVQCDVDRNGTFGEKDSIIAISSHGSNNTEHYLITPTGMRNIYHGNSINTVGNCVYVEEATGHYPWICAFHPDDGVLAMQGFANTQLGLISAMHPQDTWPVEDPYDHPLLGTGRAHIKNGTTDAAKIGLVPSFTALLNAQGGSFLGCSFDNIAEMPFAAALAFIQGGMIGTVARPDFTRANSLGILYYIYRNSQRFIREGAALITALRAFVAGAPPVVVPPIPPVVVPPIVIPPTPTPGLPAWVPAPGNLADISKNMMRDVVPSGWPTSDIAGPFVNWSGGLFATDFSVLGAYVVYGSGHLTPGSPLWAGVSCFDLDDLLWKMRNVPAAPLRDTAADYNSFGESIIPATLGHPTVPHTYDGLIYQGKDFNGGAKGSLLRHFYAGGGGRSVHQFDLSSLTDPPKRWIDNIPLTGQSSNYPATALDEARGGYWVMTYNGWGPLSFVKFSDRSMTPYPGVEFNDYGNYNLVYCPDWGCFIAIGTTGSGSNLSLGMYVSPIVGGKPTAFIKIVAAGAPPSDGRCGGQWSTILKRMVSYEAHGSRNVHSLNRVGTDWKTGWAWSSETVNGAEPSKNTFGNGAWSRFIEAPKARCFIWCDSVGGPVQAFRLAGM